MHDVDDATLAALRERLHQHRYGETALAARLGTGSVFGHGVLTGPVHSWRLRGADPLAVLARQFLLDEPATQADLDRVLGAALRARLDDAGWLGGTRILPCGGGWFATAGTVYAPGDDSNLLVHATVRDPVARVLDLCTGSGLHAVLAVHGSSVSATDLSEQAVASARMNARWAGVEVEVHRGDLYGPVTGRFEHILANPPFVPSPHADVAYRDGGDLGTEVLGPILEGLDAHLSDTGLAQLVTVLPATDEPWDARLREWLGDDVRILRQDCGPLTPEAFAVQHSLHALRTSYDAYEVEVHRWLAHLAEHRVERLDPVLLAIARARGGSSRTVPARFDDLSGQVRAWLAE